MYLFVELMITMDEWIKFCLNQETKYVLICWTYDYDEWIIFCLNQETKCIPGQAWFGGARVSALIW